MPKKKEPIKKETKKLESEQAQANVNAIGSLTELAQLHHNRLHKLEQHMQDIMDKLGKVLARMGL